MLRTGQILTTFCNKKCDEERICIRTLATTIFASSPFTKLSLCTCNSEMVDKAAPHALNQSITSIIKHPIPGRPRKRTDCPKIGSSMRTQGDRRILVKLKMNAESRYFARGIAATISRFRQYNDLNVSDQVTGNWNRWTGKWTSCFETYRKN